jgi:iron complex transport system permease protein
MTTRTEPQPAATTGGSVRTARATPPEPTSGGHPTDTAAPASAAGGTSDAAAAGRRALLLRRRRAHRALLHSGPTRAGGVLAGLAVLLVVVLCSVAFGSRSIPLGDVWQALVEPDGSNDHLIVRSLRIPRTLLGLGVGMALGLAGTLMQGVTRNPLADPGLLGVDAGAALAVVVAIHTFGITTLSGYVWFAFVGAGVASAAVYLLGSLGRGGATPVKLALAGAALTALLTALTQSVLLIDAQSLDIFRFWVVGSLAGRDGDVIVQVAPFLVVGVVLAVASGRTLNTLSLGDDVARSLGQRVALARGVAALAIVILCGAATAAAGPIGFVGLTVPHIARAICGPDYRWILAWSLVLAPTLLLGADVIGRVVARPGELQVGIVTAFLGAPFFVALVRRRKLSEL